jgi:hypothetical protein
MNGSQNLVEELSKAGGCFNELSPDPHNMENKSNKADNKFAKLARLPHPATSITGNLDDEHSSYK